MGFYDKKNPPVKLYKNRNWLYQRYWTEGLSLKKIANLCNTYPQTILNWMNKFNISKRTYAELNKGKNHPMYGRYHSKKTKEKMSKIKQGKSNPLYGKHHSEETKQKMKEAQKGDKHHSWTGGSYRYFSYMAHQVWEEYWREKVPKGYLLHHMDRDRTNYKITNILLITYSCHAKIHIQKREENNARI